MTNWREILKDLPDDVRAAAEKDIARLRDWDRFGASNSAMLHRWQLVCRAWDLYISTLPFTPGTTTFEKGH